MVSHRLIISNCLTIVKLSIFFLAVEFFFALKQNRLSPSVNNPQQRKPNSSRIERNLKYLATPINEKVQSPSKTVTKRKYSDEKLFRQVAVSGESRSLDKSTLDFDEFFDDRILLQLEWIKKVSNSEYFASLKPKRILLNGNFSFNYYYNNSVLNCPAGVRGLESKCIIIENKYPINIFSDTDMKTFDAVVQARHAHMSFERIYEDNRVRENSSRKINFIFESPYFNGNAILSKSLLASYWRGSDINKPYYKWIPFENHTRIPDPTWKKYALGKTKLTAIVVSKCDPWNARLEYVKLLQHNLTVDIYGKCGIFNCTELCLETLGIKYKFYLAFENANCRAYISEKFFRNALLNNMVRVVLGAHKKDYLYAAPPNSFVHVKDLKSPAELAEYLIKLDNDDGLYNAYFSWKGTGKKYEFTVYAICRMCAALFTADGVKIADWPL